jgi:Recombinase
MLNMLGAFAEFERAKITERMTRGRIHRLRMGQMSSNGHRIYGYHHVKKTTSAPATLVINEQQAAIVRSIFEMFASGDYGLVNISRFLEERRIPTRTGRPQWDRGQIKFMLKNETYTGTRYYNRITAATEAAREGKEVIRGKWVTGSRGMDSGQRARHRLSGAVRESARETAPARRAILHAGHALDGVADHVGGAALAAGDP